MTYDRLLESFAALVRSLTSHVDFFAMYACKVVKQNSDGTLDVQPESTKLPGMQSVPIRYGIPGVTVKVSPGGRVLLGFEGGDPQRPVVTLWDFSTVTELTITSTGTVKVNAASVVLPDGTMNVARAGDPITATVKIATGPAAGDWPATGSIDATAGNSKVKA